MVIGKLKYLIGPASGTISHPLGRRGSFLSGCTGAEWSDSVVGGGGGGGCSGSTDWKERGKVAWAGAKSIQNRPPLTA